MIRSLAKSVCLPTPRRRWAQFSLGTLLLVVTALCCWLAAVVDRAQRQREAVAALREKGATVLYDYEFAAQARGLVPASATPPGPSCIRNWLGVDYLADVALVSDLSSRVKRNPAFTDSEALRLSAFPRLLKLQFYVGSVGDRGLACLKSLRYLEELELVNCHGPPISDEGLRCCEGLLRLRTLTVTSGNITDMGLKHLARLPSLRTLVLDSPRITDVGLASLKDLPELRELALGNSAVTDAGVEHLLAMRKLEKLTLLNARASDAGLSRLAALPHLRRLELRSDRISIALHNAFRRDAPQINLIPVQVFDLSEFNEQLKSMTPGHKKPKPRDDDVSIKDWAGL